jgi:predicted DNA-binding transcriptional regulator AlpA
MSKYPKTLAPLHEVPIDGLLRIPQILKIIPVSESGLFAMIKEGRFPKPIKLGAKTSVWKVTDIQEYINSFTR